jgi:hypothetical protein
MAKVKYRELIQALEDYSLEHCRGGYVDEADTLRDDVINALRDGWDRETRFNKLWEDLNYVCNHLTAGHDMLSAEYVRDLLESTSE